MFLRERNMCVSVLYAFAYAHCANKPSFIQFTSTERKKKPLWPFFAACHSLARHFGSLKPLVLLHYQMFYNKPRHHGETITNELPWDSGGCGPPCISSLWHTAAIIVLSQAALRSSVMKYEERGEKMAAYYDAWFTLSSCAFAPEEVGWLASENARKRWVNLQ